MIDAYMKGRDLYAVIAQSAFHNNYEDNLEFYPEGTVIEENGKQITCGYKTHMNKQGKDRRKVGKTLQLAATYGMSGATAGIRLGYTGKDAKKQGTDLLNKFFAGFPAVKKTIDYSKQFLKEHGYVEDWAGRRRHLPEINLPKYTVHLKENNEIANFNPFLGCADRDDQTNSSVQYWLAVVKNRITASQNWQAKKAAEEGYEYTPNGEMKWTDFEIQFKQDLLETNRPMKVLEDIMYKHSGSPDDGRVFNANLVIRLLNLGKDLVGFDINHVVRPLNGEKFGAVFDVLP
jgi:hypothetical protein